MRKRPELDALDRALKKKGSNVVLRRMLGAPSNQVPSDVKCKAWITSYRLRDQEEVSKAPQSAQSELLVTISPTSLLKAGWPGGIDPLLHKDQNMPVKGDLVKIGDTFCKIEVVDVSDINGDVVRIDMRVLG